MLFVRASMIGCDPGQCWPLLYRLTGSASWKDRQAHCLPRIMMYRWKQTCKSAKLAPSGPLPLDRPTTSFPRRVEVDEVLKQVAEFQLSPFGPSLVLIPSLSLLVVYSRDDLMGVPVGQRSEGSSIVVAREIHLRYQGDKSNRGRLPSERPQEALNSGWGPEQLFL
ncbi:hypothetical protein BDV06DRAFT_194863, partial [Aspergillus oleicola]